MPPSSLEIASVGVGWRAPQFDPFTHLFVGGTGGNEIAKGFCVDAGAAEEALIEWAVELVVAIQSDEGCAAFIESARGELMPGERFVRRTGFMDAKIRSQLANRIEILIGHRLEAYRFRGRRCVEENRAWNSNGHISYNCLPGKGFLISECKGVARCRRRRFGIRARFAVQVPSRV